MRKLLLRLEIGFNELFGPFLVKPSKWDWLRDYTQALRDRLEFLESSSEPEAPKCYRNPSAPDRSVYPPKPYFTYDEWMKYIHDEVVKNKTK